MRRSGLSIGRLAAQTGVNLETVRYYERIGLMPAAERTQGGHRVYSEAPRRRLTFIRRARMLGFSIEDIRALLDLSEPGSRSCKDVERIAADHLQEVQAKIADLARLEGLLAGAVGRCATGEGASCPVLDMLEDS